MEQGNFSPFVLSSVGVCDSILLYVKDSLLLAHKDLLGSLSPSFWASRTNMILGYNFPYSPKIPYEELWGKYVTRWIDADYLVGSLDFGSKTVEIFDKYLVQRPNLDITSMVRGMVRYGNEETVVHCVVKYFTEPVHDMVYLQGIFVEALKSNKEDLLIRLRAETWEMTLLSPEEILTAKFYRYFDIFLEERHDDFFMRGFFSRYGGIHKVPLDRDLAKYLLSNRYLDDYLGIYLPEAFVRAVEDDNLELLRYFTTSYDEDFESSGFTRTNPIDEPLRRDLMGKINIQTESFRYFFSTEDYFDLYDVLLSNLMAPTILFQELVDHANERSLLKDYALRDKSKLLRKTLWLPLDNEIVIERLKIFSQFPHDKTAVLGEIYEVLMYRYGKSAGVIFKYLPYQVKDLTLRQQKDLLHKILTGGHRYVTISVFDHLNFPLKVLQAGIGRFVNPKKVTNFTVVLPLLERVKNLSGDPWRSSLLKLNQDATNPQDKVRIEALLKRSRPGR